MDYSLALFEGKMVKGLRDRAYVAMGGLRESGPWGPG